MDVELGVDALRMHAHGVLGDHQLLGDAHHGLAAHDVLHDLGFSCAQAELLADAGRLLGDAVLVNRLAIGMFASWSDGSLSLCGTVGRRSQ